MVDTFDFSERPVSGRSGARRLAVALVVVLLVACAGAVTFVVRPGFASVVPGLATDDPVGESEVPVPKVAGEPRTGPVDTAGVSDARSLYEGIVGSGSESGSESPVAETPSVVSSVTATGTSGGRRGAVSAEYLRGIVSDKVNVRAAHQCNSVERVDEVRSAWAVEVDVREPDGEGDVHLYHDDEHGLRLSVFLGMCKERCQVAILDMKGGSDLAETVRIVAEADMFDRVRFQVGSLKSARRLHELDPRCLTWLLNGAGHADETLRLDELSEGSDVLCGINVCGKVLQPDARGDIDAVHAVSGCTGAPMELCVFGYGRGDTVYGQDAAYADAGVNVLMADLVPSYG